MMSIRPRSADWRTPAVVLVCGGIVLALAVGIRHGFGLFLQPMSADLGWGRETFAFAMALQHLLWGAAQPYTGMLADRHGAGRVLAAGAAIYVLGLVLMAYSQSGLALGLSAGVLIGLGLSGTTFSVVLGAIGRAYPPERRSMALGIAAAAGSFGQFALLPIEQTLIDHFGWLNALLLLAVMATAMVPLAAALAERRPAPAVDAPRQSAAEAVREAFGHRGFVLLTLGFFVCGFQVVFIAVHFPAYLLDRGLTAHDGMTALALIGFCNVIGTWAGGWLGGRFSKKYLLSGLYFGRSVVIAAFLLAPITPLTLYLFSAAIGLLWLATVPLTNGLIAQIFGTRHFSMLGGFVFFSHQIGSFLGVWLGGLMYDRTASYDLVWLAAIGLGIAAGIANLPIDERAVRRAPGPSTA